MQRRSFMKAAGLAACASLTPSFSYADGKRPNIVFILTDDQGYGDLGCYGSETLKTPRIDRMAAEGMSLTSFYAAPVCTPSRAQLLTGCFPHRVDMGRVVLAEAAKGLNPSELTIPKTLKQKGYATGIFGKWHLGDQWDFLPLNYGFDEFWGTPYSNDIWHRHPNKDFHFPPLPLFEGNRIIEIDPDQFTLTQRTTDKAIDFISRHKDEPFFCYVPYNMPHLPIHASELFLERHGMIRPSQEEMEELYSRWGTKYMFPPCIEELDHSVGRILDTLVSLGLDDDTLVVFTSDNGPNVGSAGPFRGRKGSIYEGGSRVPCIFRWPGHIPAGEKHDGITGSMDILPTLAALVGAELPRNHSIDGIDIWPIISGGNPDGRGHDTFPYQFDGVLRAMRQGPWKLHLKTAADGSKIPFELYNLDDDIGEKKNVLGNHPDVVKRLLKKVSDYLNDIGEPGRPGRNFRKAAFVDNPKPLVPHIN